MAALSTTSQAQDILEDEALAEELNTRQLQGINGFVLNSWKFFLASRVSVPSRDSCFVTASVDLRGKGNLFQKLLEELETGEIPSYIREARLAELKHKAVEFQELQKQGHGVYNDIVDEKSFLEITTSEDKCIVHFYHTDFRRCSVMDTHLEKLTEKYYETKFAKMNVDKAKFLVEKLQIRVLPAVFCFLKGIVKDRITGFEELGGSDNFQTVVLEKRFAQSGVIEMAEEELEKKTIFGYRNIREKDEDSSDDDDGY